MKSFKKAILAGVISAAVCFCANGEDPSVALQTVVQAMDLLRERGIMAETNGLETALLKNLVMAADPGGTLPDAKELSSLERETRGVWCVPDIHFTKTGKTVSVAEPLPEGFESGDAVEMVDGKGIGDLPAEEILRRLSGDCDAGARLTIRRGGSAEHDLELARTEKPVPPVAAVEKLNPETGYVKLFGCHPGTAAALAPVLTEWKTSGVYGVVLDLRAAGGASREDVCRILGIFTAAEGELFRTVPLAGGPEICTVPDGGRLGLPAMVLVDESTTGAAELLAAGLQGMEAGSMILGRKTAGDFMLRENLRLNGDRSMRVASRMLKFPDGRERRANEGLVPDIVIEPRKGKPAEAPGEDMHLRLKNDVALQRACDLLQGLRVLKIGIREESKTPEN
ncbi:MAG: S41 family peptidase [Kiritimatiellia bacterium]